MSAVHEPSPRFLEGGRTLIRDLRARVGERVTLRGFVHHRRHLGGLAFLDLRDRTGVVQCVAEGIEPPLHESSVIASGVVVAHPKAPGGIEVRLDDLSIVTRATTPPPVEMAKIDAHTHPETLLEYRHVTIRSPRDRATLKVQAELLRAFRAFLDGHDFTEISTPKLVSAGAEGGAHQFEVDYYGQRAYLAQSPQLYKQIMVGVFERVYEVAPVYRAEPSHTVRHLAEYLSLDVEVGFIRDEGDVMDLQEALLRSMMADVAARCSDELALLGASLPAMAPFPRIPLLEARALVRERYGHASGGKDLDPEAERLLGRYALEEYGSDFVFVTRYPEAARPFYAYADGDGFTRGLDLLFRGTEITSGGQRAHELEMLLRGLATRNLDPAGFEGYLSVFRHGMPPHGGFAIGAERLTALLLGIPNVRFARSFPRDGHRLQP
jgi:nondiscriminating aspartyl-tRNA synthetase